MKRFFTFAVAAALVTATSTTAWSKTGGPSSYTRANPFNDSRVRRQLDLSQNQVRQLRALNNSWRQQLARQRRGAGNDATQWDQMWQQYVTMLNGVLTQQQQQTWSQLASQLSASRPGSSAARTGASAEAARTVNAGGAASGSAVATTQQAAANRASQTQAEGGGGSSAVGTSLVTGQPAQIPGPTAPNNRAGSTQAQAGGGSSAFGTSLLTGDPVNLKGVPLGAPGKTQAQGGGGSSFFGSGGTVP